MKATRRQPLDTGEVIAGFERALPEVYDYLFHRCRNRAVAEDLTSETFLAAVREIRDDHQPDLNVAWLIGIARHKLVDHWRRREREERRLALVSNEAATEDPMPEVDPGRGMEVLAQLNPMQTAALTLRHVDGLSVPEVAAALGRSVHATETLLTRARSNFRRIYLRPDEQHDD
jgi:RNA polymerase sigma-70 factor (ECF subfamily)